MPKSDSRRDDDELIIQASELARHLRTSRLGFNSTPEYYHLLRENELAGHAVQQMRAQHLRGKAILSPYQVERTLGQHILAEFHFENREKLSIGLFRKIMLFAAIQAKATILTSHFFETNDNGISGVVVIAESHFIIHYFPTENYLALDIYTCGDMNTDLALSYIIEKLKVKPYDMTNFKRGVLRDVPPFSTSDNSLYPGIAIKSNSYLRFFESSSHTVLKNTARSSIANHSVGEFYCSDTNVSNNGDEILNAFREVFDTVDFKFFYIKQFKPQGVSVVAMADGIHISTHPWPELKDNYSPVDMFVSSKSGIDTRATMERLAMLFRSSKYTINDFPRGVYDKVSEQLIPIFNELLPKPISVNTGHSVFKRFYS